jgi:hypothetical protein
MPKATPRIPPAKAARKTAKPKPTRKRLADPVVGYFVATGEYPAGCSRPDRAFWFEVIEKQLSAIGGVRLAYILAAALEKASAAKLKALSTALAYRAEPEPDPVVGSLLAEIRPVLRNAGIAWSRQYLEKVKVPAFGDMTAPQLLSLRAALAETA